MVVDLRTRLLLHCTCASFFALGSPVIDLLRRPLKRSILSEIMDLKLTNQITVTVFVTSIF